MPDVATRLDDLLTVYRYDTEDEVPNDDLGDTYTTNGGEVYTLVISPKARRLTDLTGVDYAHILFEKNRYNVKLEVVIVLLLDGTKNGYEVFNDFMQRSRLVPADKNDGWTGSGDGLCVKVKKVIADL